MPYLQGPNGQRIPITDDQAQSYQAMQSIVGATEQQPAAGLAQTQQSTQTGQAEQQSIQTQIPGQAAESGIKQVQQQQATTPQLLAQSLKKGMTLQDAINTYTTNGAMKADDIFKQYLGENTFGPNGTPKFPVETPAQLQNMGITPNALGQIGTPGSFMDRYNTKNALTELRGLHTTWNQTDALSHIPFLGGGDSTGRAYQAQKQVVGEHLSSLIPGASSSQGSNQELLNSLPNIGDEFAPGAAAGQFSKVEQALLQSKGYSLKDLGLAPQVTQAPSKTSGGDLLSYLTKTASNVPGDIGKTLNGILDTPANMVKQDQQLASQGKFQQIAENGNPNTLIKNALMGYLGNLNKDVGNPLQGGDVVGRIGQNFQNRPVSTVLDALPFLAAGKASLLSKGGDVADAVDSGAEAPNLGIKARLLPGKVIGQVGDYRDAVVSAGQKAGNVAQGSDIAKSWADWGATAKAGNMSDANAIDEAVANAQKIYGNEVGEAPKTFTPNQLYDSYKQIENGYTKGSLPKSSTSSYIDRASQDILQKHLESVAPGFQESSNLFSQLYGYKKGYLANMLKPTNIAKVGLGVFGAERLKALLGL